MGYRLDLVDGLRIMKSFPLEAGIPARIGRSAQNAIRLNDDRVSRRHCLLSMRDDKVTLTDLGSHNGTKVNGHFVTERVLQDGDQLVVGNTMLIFRGRDEAAVPEAARAMVGSGEMTVTMGAPVVAAAGESIVKAVLRHRDSRYLNADLLDAIPGDELRMAGTLKALYKVTSSVLSIRSITELLQQLLDLVFECVPAAERATVLLTGEGGTLEPRATKSRLAESTGRPEVSLSIAVRSFKENVAILSQDAQTDSRFAEQQSVVIHGIRSAMCVPIGSPSRTWGVLYVDRRSIAAPFSEEQLDFLLAVSRQVGLALENLHLWDEHRKTFESLIRTLAASIDAKDPVTAGHSDRVARYTMALADRLGLPREQKRILRLAAYLHDYGKIGIRDAVLMKPARLTPEEYEEIKEHPRYTGELLSKIHFGQGMRDIPIIAMSHHERMDGTGYPQGLKGDAIPLGSKIIAIADIWDAFTSPRQYKRGWTLDESVRELKALKGTYLDPELVDLFVLYVEDELRPAAEGGRVPPPGKRDIFDTDEMLSMPVPDSPAAPPTEGKDPILW